MYVISVSIQMLWTAHSGANKFNEQNLLSLIDLAVSITEDEM